MHVDLLIVQCFLQFSTSESVTITIVILGHKHSSHTIISHLLVLL